MLAAGLTELGEEVGRRGGAEPVDQQLNLKPRARAASMSASLTRIAVLSGLNM